MVKHAVSRKGVLLVDSRGQLTASLKGLLERKGFRVETLASSLEALQRVECGDFDVVVCDLADSALSIAAIETELATRCPHLANHCVFLQSPEHEGEEEGPMVCQRPLDPDELIEKISRLTFTATASAHR